MAINLSKIGELDDQALAALDPYLYWFLASGFKDFERRPGGRFDVMIELKVGKKVSDLASALPDLANHLVLLYGETAAIAYTSATVDVQGLLALLKRPDLVDRVQLAAPLHAPRARGFPAHEIKREPL
jgi:hypothetical protein